MHDMATGDDDAESGLKTNLKFTPTSLDSLDARIIQYKYGMTKLKFFILALDDLLKKYQSNSDSDNIVLVQYMAALCFNIFAISENTFGVKLSGLEQFKTLKGSKAPISKVVTHVPYDMKDHSVTPLEELPSRTSSIACLKSLKMMCIVCMDGYQKRLDNALKELKNEDFISDLNYLFENEFFNVKGDFDLTLIARLFPDDSLEYGVDSLLLSSQHYSEAALIDMDLKILVAIISETQVMLDFHKPYIAKYRSLKQLPVSECEKQFNTMPFVHYSLHRIFFWSLRINEIYLILRRFGRQIYVSNYNHLHDQNFLLTLRNPSYFKKLLSDMDELFLSTKKNGVLIATITRFIRLSSVHSTSPKNVLSFIGYINQSVALIESELRVLKEVAKLWIVGELSFREAHNLPVEFLSKLNDVVEKERLAEIRASRANSQALLNEKNRKNLAPKATSFPSEQTKHYKTSKVIDAPSIIGKEPAKVNPQTGSENQLNIKISSDNSKPSMYLHKHSSSNSLQLSSNVMDNTEKANALTTVNGGRKRSDSQPISFNAAATALKGSSPVSKQSSPLASPSGSIRRASSVSKKSSSLSIASPLRTKERTLDQPDIKENTAPPKLTANQKFQQHLIEASKSGILVGKEKKTLHDVVFDPNNPLSINLRKQATAQPKSSTPSRDEPIVNSITASEETCAETVQVQRPTISQVTKRNTKRNSVVYQTNLSRALSVTSPELNSPDVSEISSKSSQSHETTIKKVRFTGVSEYTPAEDEPSSQLSRILKKFATFKSPLIKSLRSEEGQALKHEFTGGQAAGQGLSGFINASSLSPLRLTRFKNRF